MKLHYKYLEIFFNIPSNVEKGQSWNSYWLIIVTEITIRPQPDFITGYNHRSLIYFYTQTNLQKSCFCIEQQHAKT